MQHTSKYQFKLIEGTDDFSPAPLNQNAQKTETLLAGMEEDLAALEADLAGQIQDVEESVTAVTTALGTGGHNARIAWGTYTGTGTYGASAPTVFSCDFYPVLLVAEWENYQFGHPLVLLNGVVTMPTVYGGSYHNVSVNWAARQVTISSTVAADVQFNMEGATYHYMILGYDDN